VGESASVPTDEETTNRYQSVKELYNRELAFYGEAQKALLKWRADHQEGWDPLDPRWLQLNRELNDANQRLMNGGRQDLLI